MAAFLRWGSLDRSREWVGDRNLASKARAKKSGRSDRRGQVLNGGKKPQVRASEERSWTKAKAKSFLSVLEETCNVALACREAGVSSSAVYRYRAKDAAFRAGWRDAIATAYRRLELVLLERAFNGSEKIVTRKDGSEERVREYPNAIALQLLKMHHGDAVESEREPGPGEEDELRRKLQRKIERLRERLLAEDKTSE